MRRHHVERKHGERRHAHQRKAAEERVCPKTCRQLARGRTYRCRMPGSGGRVRSNRGIAVHDILVRTLKTSGIGVLFAQEQQHRYRRGTRQQHDAQGFGVGAARRHQDGGNDQGTQRGAYLIHEFMQCKALATAHRRRRMRDHGIARRRANRLAHALEHNQRPHSRHAARKPHGRHRKRRDGIPRNREQPVAARAIGQRPGHQAAHKRCRLAQTGDKANRRRRGAQRREQGALHAQGALVHHIHQHADQAKAHDESRRRQSAPASLTFQALASEHLVAQLPWERAGGLARVFAYQAAQSKTTDNDRCLADEKLVIPHMLTNSLHADETQRGGTRQQTTCDQGLALDVLDIGPQLIERVIGKAVLHMACLLRRHVRIDASGRQQIAEEQVLLQHVPCACKAFFR